ncbi:transcription factor BIM2-like isoform X2 [Ananas comosus]|nr:transcription factor BIM2-like isoform X2 [Ananas comosus]
MELRGKKTTHDFLSLHTVDPSFKRHDTSPSSSQGFFIKTRDFLQPLDDREEESAGRDPAVGPTEEERTLPGGIGAFSISHVSGPGSRAPLKPDRGTCGAVRGFGVKSKPEPDIDSGVYTTQNVGVLGAPFSTWAHSTARDSGPSSRGPWPSPFAAARANGFVGSLSFASRDNAATEGKRSMEAASRSSRGAFDDDDDDDGDEFGRREASSSRKELSIKVDGKGSGSGSGTDQRPNTPRSKHSATEQRRRSKINDRFQILRELIPQGDQKRDKASFLLEVIEYIRFLQEKVQKYEATNPEWNQESSNLLPWVNVYFRSFWKSAQSNNHGLSDPLQAIKNGSSPSGYMFSGKYTDNGTQVAPAVLTGVAQNRTETEMMTAGFSSKAMETPQNFINESMSGAQAPWLRPHGAADSAVNGEMLSEQEELAIDQATVNFSNAYSQGVLTTLTQTLQNSGIDLSQANLSVQINLARRSKRTNANVTACTTK